MGASVLQRRLLMNLRSQNWFAIGLEVVVVVVGIFLAFQVERWYAEKLTRAVALERIDALGEDFVQNREELTFQTQRLTTVLDASENLLELDERNPTIEDYDSFYEWLAATSRAPTSRFRRGGYDVLISTGEIDLIADRLLQRDIADFYAFLDELQSVKDGTLTRKKYLFEPYVVKNLDHIQMLEKIHPPDSTRGIKQNRPTQDKGQFLHVVGTVEFEGVIGAMWHSARDELRQLEDLEASLLSIEDRMQHFTGDRQD
jgi:hypothetical protein